jgi:hypothetical protein
MLPAGVLLSIKPGMQCQAFFICRLSQESMFYNMIKKENCFKPSPKIYPYFNYQGEENESQ